jgi:hypothetical protein
MKNEINFSMEKNCSPRKRRLLDFSPAKGEPAVREAILAWCE